MDEMTEEHKQLIFNFNELSPHRLSSYARLVLIKFISLFGTQKTNDSLLELSEKIGVQHKKLKLVLEELSGFEILEFSYPETGRRARVRTIQLNLDYLNLLLSKVNQHETSHHRYVRLKRAIKQFDLLMLILIKLSQVRVTTKKFDLLPEQKLDFRVLLTLSNLTRSCDAYGVIRNIGTTQLVAKTGLNKQAIFDSIYFLKKIGLLRVHVHGTINNKFIKNITPTYVLNLSHTFWGNHARYGRFYILEASERHHFEIKMIADIFTVISEQVQPLDSDNSRDLNHLTTLVLKGLDSDKINIISGTMIERIQSSSQVQETISSFIKECLIHYLQLQQCHQEQGDLTVFAKVFKQALINKKKQHIKLNDLDSNLTMMQCYFEAWCCRLLDQRGLRQHILQGSLLYGVDILNRTTIEKDIYPFVFQEKYRLELITNPDLIRNSDPDADIQIQIQKLEKQEQRFILEFLLFCLNLIAKNQILPFLKSTRRLSHVAGKFFQIIPKVESQKMYSCIYVPDSTLTKDEFFLIDIPHPIRGKEEEYSNEDYLLKFIEPSVDDMKKYGLLDQFYTGGTELLNKKVA
ncbi:hypothetical protein [Acinetobacter sp. 99]|uniref:hypothetical protein n=1 Tax=Acinetobacter sp. 99 TaxID=3098765 RepID=UPI00300AF2C0